MNQISPGKQPVRDQASDLNRHPHVDKARALWDKARRLWPGLHRQRQVILAVGALLVAGAALAVPTTAFFGEHKVDMTRSLRAHYATGSSAPAARFYATVLSYRSQRVVYLACV
jgi:hypothetical protein